MNLERMEIIKANFVEGAKKAAGIVVVIDVFRAFSVACYCFDRGVSCIYPVGEIEKARNFSKTLDSAILIGERKGKKIPGFDYGNSPTEILAANLDGKTVVHTTHAGTQGIVNATGADEVLTGAFVNARATTHYIKSRHPEIVTLVKMGLEAKIPSDEDDLCADYFESLLTNKKFDEAGIYQSLRNSPFAARFFDPKKPWNPPSDFELCLDINRFTFALGALKDKSGNLKIEKIASNK